MRIRHLAALLVILAPATVVAKDDTPAKPVKSEAAADETPIYGFVILQGLNKVTGKISRLEGPVTKAMHFGNLEITAKRCWKAPPEDQPENASLLEIREVHGGEESKRIFLGWMFSSSPGLSGLENAVYDINVVSCELHATPAKADEKVASPPEAEAGLKKAPVIKSEPVVKKPVAKVKKTN